MFGSITLVVIDRTRRGLSNRRVLGHGAHARSATHPYFSSSGVFTERPTRTGVENAGRGGILYREGIGGGGRGPTKVKYLWSGFGAANGGTIARTGNNKTAPALCVLHTTPKSCQPFSGFFHVCVCVFPAYFSIRFAVSGIECVFVLIVRQSLPEMIKLHSLHTIGFDCVLCWNVYVLMGILQKLNDFV